MKLISKGWGRVSEVNSASYRLLGRELNILPHYWSRFWEYPFLVFNTILGGSSSLNILDVGCGGSLLIPYFIKRRFKVTGVDIDDVSKDFEGIDFIQGDIREVELPKEEFDRIFCVSVLEHLDSRIGEAIENMISALKFGGLLGITVDINRYPLSRFRIRKNEFERIIANPLGFECGAFPMDLLKSEDTESGRRAGAGLRVFGFILEKEETND